MGNPWKTVRGLSMDYPWVVHGVPMNCPWVARELSMGCRWTGHGQLVGNPSRVAHR